LPYGRRFEFFPKKYCRSKYKFLILPAMKSFSNETKNITSEVTDVLTSIEEPCSLIVWNDDVNTFEWVIETLIEVCGHTEEQAEQCAYLVHFKGKCDVKQGEYEKLKVMCDKITDRGIGATVEITA
jgi:ATP-dependent Clp protease adaptor protein ClpS